MATVLGSVGLAGGFAAYGQDAAGMAGALDKTKHKKKEKSKNGVGISSETYIEIKNEPVLKQPAEYSGRYADEGSGYSLDLRVASDGSAEGSGIDTLGEDTNSGKREFTLRNARVQGAVLTAEKVFADGRAEPLEAVFVNRTTLEGKNPNSIETRETAFGLGFVQKYSGWTSRVFLKAR